MKTIKYTILKTLVPRIISMKEKYEYHKISNSNAVNLPAINLIPYICF